MEKETKNEYQKKTFTIDDFTYSLDGNEYTREICVNAKSSNTNETFERREDNDKYGISLYNDEFERKLLEGEPKNYPLYLAHKLMKHYHKYQVDRGGTDYYLHPEYVGNKGETLEEKIVGYLHDIIEDTPMTLRELSKYFPSRIIEAVDAISRHKGENDESYFDRISSNYIATKVKLQDLLHNLNFSRIKKHLPDLEDAKRMINYANQVYFLLNVLKYKFANEVNFNLLNNENNED